MPRFPAQEGAPVQPNEDGSGPDESRVSTR